jgi:hypothetical protein
MMIRRKGHWYAVELPVAILIALVPMLFVLIVAALSGLRGLLR